MAEHVLCDKCKGQIVLNLDQVNDFKKTAEFKKLEVAYKNNPKHRLTFDISKRANTYQFTIRVYFNLESFIVYFIPFDKVQKFLLGFTKALDYKSYFQIIKGGETIWSVEKYPSAECPDKLENGNYSDIECPDKLENSFLSYKANDNDGKESLFYFPIYRAIEDKLFKLEIVDCVDNLEETVKRKQDWLANENFIITFIEPPRISSIEILRYYVQNCDMQPDISFQVWPNKEIVAGTFFLLVTWGLVPQKTPWHTFLTRGLYDPRLLLLIFAFTSNRTKWYCTCECHLFECYCYCDIDYIDTDCQCICHAHNCCECAKI